LAIFVIVNVHHSVISASNLDNTRQATTGLVKIVNEPRQRDGDEMISLPQTADLHIFHRAAQHKVPATSHAHNAT